MKRFAMNLIVHRLTFIFGIAVFAVIGVFAISQSAQAMTGTVITGSEYVWGENIGWMNFAATSGNVNVTDTALTGYVWSYSYGWINLGPFTNYAGVTNTLSGQLGGYAWSSGLGWIPMSGASINTATGVFHGIAGNSSNMAARINFDCSTCMVATNWRPTSTPSATSTSTTSVASNTTIPSTAAVAVVPLPAAPAEAQTGNPSQLFDIRLSIKNQSITQLSDLVAQVSFTNFGTVATPVTMTFSILDSNSKVAWTGQDSITVQTESLFTKSFSSLKNLPAGKYTLKLSTVYNGTVTDDFMSSFSIIESTAWYTQASNWLFSLFGVSKTTGQALLSNWWWLVLVIVLLLLFLFLSLFWKHRLKKAKKESLEGIGRRH